MDQGTEIKRLKTKCNLQLEEILNLKKTVKDQEGEIKNLKKSYSGNKGKPAEKIINEKDDNLSVKNQVEEYAKILIRIIDRLHDGKLFINYKNACKNSKEFYRLKSEDFQAVAEEFIKESEMKRFYKFCAGLGVVKSSSGSCIFNDVIQGKAIKVVYIRKEAFEVIQDDR